jgi:hypothetical protein
MIFGVNMLAALNAEAMIKLTGGHACVHLLIDFGRSSLETACPRFDKEYVFLMNQKNELLRQSNLK